MTYFAKSTMGGQVESVLLNGYVLLQAEHLYLVRIVILVDRYVAVGRVEDVQTLDS